MVKITKAERDKLIAMGVKTGENGISRTYSTHGPRHYFLCESPYNMKRLKQIRK